MALTAAYPAPEADAAVAAAGVGRRGLGEGSHEDIKAFKIRLLQHILGAQLLPHLHLSRMLGCSSFPQAWMAAAATAMPQRWAALQLTFWNPPHQGPSP